MSKSTYLTIFTAILLTACYQDQDFRAFYQQYQQKPIPKELSADNFFLQPAMLQQRVNHCLYYQRHLSNFEVDSFSPRNKERHQQLQEECDYCLHQIGPYINDPSLYNMGGQLKYILVQNSQTLKTRLKIIQQHLIGVEEYYQVGKTLLATPLPNRAQLGAQKQLVALQFLDSELKDSIALAGLNKQELEALNNHIAQAKIVLKDYLAFCESLYFEHHDSIPLK